MQLSFSNVDLQKKNADRESRGINIGQTTTTTTPSVAKTHIEKK